MTTARAAILAEHLHAPTWFALPQPDTNGWPDAVLALVSYSVHECRSDLSVASELSSLLIDGLYGDLDEEQKQFVSSISDRVARSCEQLRYLHDVAEACTGQVFPHRVLLSPEAWCKKLENGLRLQPHEEREQAVPPRILKARTLPAIYCDATLFRRCIEIVSWWIRRAACKVSTVEIEIAVSPMETDVEISFLYTGPTPERGCGSLSDQWSQAARQGLGSAPQFGWHLELARHFASLNLGGLEWSTDRRERSHIKLSVPVFEVGSIVNRYLKTLPTVPRIQTCTAAEASFNAAGKSDAFLRVAAYYQQTEQLNLLLLPAGPQRTLLLLPQNRPEAESTLERIRELSNDLPFVDRLKSSDWTFAILETCCDEKLWELPRMVYRCHGQQGNDARQA